MSGFLVLGAATQAAMTGAAAYDRAAIAALRAAGHTVSVCEPASPLPAPTAETRPPLGELFERATDLRPIVGGLILPDCDPATLSARAAIGLVHHPLSDDIDLKPEWRDALRGREREAFAALARIVVTSRPTAEHLAADFGVPRERITVVSPGTPPAERSTGSGGPGCALLSVGTLTPRKGHDVLLRSLARLHDLDWHLTIVGRGSGETNHAAMLRTLADELRVAARVTLAGELDDQALERAWQRADAFALATHWEGYGMAIAEALRHGLPVAVTAGGAAAHLVAPEAGVIAPPGDVDQLSKAMRRVIIDADLRREMSDAAWAIGLTLPDWPTQMAAFVAAVTP